MPIYEYECNKCGHRFEVIQRHSDPLIESCGECQGPVRKLISSPAFQFKGTGWYVTDYARKGKSDAKDQKDHKEKSSDSSKSSSSDSSSEKKTEKKKEKSGTSGSK